MKPIQELNPITLRIIQLLELCSSPSHIHQIQAQLIIYRLHYDTRVAFHFINACHSQTLLSSAFSLFTQIPEPHVFICNNLLKAFSHAHMFNYSVSLYSHMNRNSISPNNYTFPFLLKSLSDKPDFKLGQPVHAQVVKTGHFYDIYVQNALLNLYASCGGRMGMCHKVFDEMPQRDVVSWTVLIAGNRGAGRFDEALIAFQQMQYTGVEPNRVTMVNALAACAGLGALEMGVWIHDCVRKNGWELDVILGTALIDMYGTCGKIEEGMKVFKMMNNKNHFTWNALIKGLALAKSGEEVVSWFFQMEREAIKPDEVTLITVLNACSQSGLVDIGREIFSLLVNGKYGFAPGAKHYSCMIDLLARIGFLKDARDLMEIMPCEPTNVMWGALLAGCRAHKNYELSEFVAWKLVEMEPENSAHYVVLSNLYAEMGRWADVSKVRGLMEERELMKDLGNLKESRLRGDVFPPSLNMRPLIDQLGELGLHKVESVRDAMKIRQRVKVSGQVLGGAKPSLVHVEHLRKLGNMGVDNRLVGFFALQGDHKHLVDDGLDVRVVMLGLNFHPLLHQSCLLEIVMLD